MDEWFKARLIWLDGIEALSDAEAGRLAKALWRFAATGETVAASGGEKFALATCLATLRKDQEDRTKLSETRSRAGTMGGRPKAKESKKSNCFSEKAKESKKSNCTHIRNKNKESSSVGFFDDDDEAIAIQQDHDEILDAAERVGLASNDFERDDLIGLYAEHGKPALLSALDQYGKHKGKSIAYLRAILAGGPKKETADDPNADYFATAVRL